jgi:hypothetical protein
MRKAAFPLLVLLCAWTISLQAQQTTVIVENAGEEDDLHLKIGALAGLTLAMNTTDYQVSGVSRSLAPGSQFGVRASIPLGRRTRVVAGLGYHTLAFKDENKRISFNDNIQNHSTDIPNEGTLTTTGSFQYTIVTAMLQFSQFFIGMNIGLPMSSEITNEGDNFTIPEAGIDPAKDWADSPQYSVGRLIRPDITPAKDDVSTLLELRAGGEFPIIKGPMGDLNLGISLGWTFNTILKESRDNLPNFKDQFYLPSALVHVSYMFNI